MLVMIQMKTVYLIGVDSTTPTATMAAVLMKLRGPDVNVMQLSVVTTVMKLVTVYLMVVKMETVWVKTVAINVIVILDSVEDSVKTLMIVLESRVVAEECVWMEFTTSPASVTQATLELCVNQVETACQVLKLAIYGNICMWLLCYYI